MGARSEQLKQGGGVGGDVRGRQGWSQCDMCVSLLKCVRSGPFGTHGLHSCRTATPTAERVTSERDTEREYFV